MQVKPESPAAPAVVVYRLADALAALGPGRPVVLLSAPGAGCFAGCGWWRALVQQARASHPATPAADILDCADAAGRALEALRIGQKILILRDCPARPSVAAAAEACGARLLADRPPALDLARRGAIRHLPVWLGLHGADQPC